eukprot:TRINITY_DN88076_c0_g1_i1.p1 TRINITY_DN88076_c0_g1~~TRINITY_DN88076_c0_g1_i1.p1  ORF type:complete len:916 (-),score=104.18 TRINITY_DN88076_c0_g1_i1:7-2703(-)
MSYVFFFAMLTIAAARTRHLLDEGWKFYKIGTPLGSCTDSDFPDDYSNKRCTGLQLQAQVFDKEGCRATCCGDAECAIYQWCPAGSSSCSPAGSCLTGRPVSCEPGQGWASRGRHVQPAPPSPRPGQDCAEQFCMVSANDTDWRVVDLPHDFVVENNFTSKADQSHGFLPYSKGWYRLHFSLDSDAKGKSVWIEFDGVQRDSTAYLNGKMLGNHLSGYTSFRFDLSKAAVFGGNNVLAIKVDATAPDSWWYDGGGIYRHVWLNVADHVHIAPWGVYLPSHVTGPISGDARADATLKIETLVLNEGSADASVYSKHVVRDPNGRQVAGSRSQTTTIKAGFNATLMIEILIKSADLWSDDRPLLYSCESTLSNGDVVTNTFGIRKMEWGKDNGFILNGKPVKIKGFANHQDFAGVGVAVPDSLQAYRVWQQKQMGSNGWRTAHNPPTPALLDECDRQGMLVWDEHHRNHASPDMLEDMRSMVLRDRNHPSIIMWSLCNEALCENFNADTAKVLKAIVLELDPHGQRPVTAAMNGGYGSAFQDVLQVMGVNYHVNLYDDLHKKRPEQPLIGSETSSDYSDRYIYQNDKTTRMYVSSYDVNYPAWGNTAEDAWCAIAERPFVAGGFYWTNFDYKGEPTPYSWPNINSHFGVSDIAGFPKDNYYYHQSVFFDASVKPIVHIVPMHWNFNEGELVDVWVYTNGNVVDLFLNDKHLGRKTIIPCRHVQWRVSFSPGKLRADAYLTGSHTVMASDIVATTGAASRIALDVEWPLSQTLNADNSDTALVTVRVLDHAGREVRTTSPNSSMQLSFSLSGEGRIIGKGNGDPSNHEPDKPESPRSATHSIWNGRARILMQATHKPGDVTLQAEGAGLEKASLTIPVRAVQHSNSLPAVRRELEEKSLWV